MSKKHTMAALACLAGTICLADSANTNNLNEAELAARREKGRLLQLRLTGGQVKKPNSGKGCILVLNVQKRVSVAAFPRTFLGVRRMLHLPLVIRDGEIPGGKPSVKAVRAAKADLAIFVVDDKESQSTVLVSPEERWATVNVNALVADNPNKGVLEERVRKEVLRAFGWLCGAANSKANKTVLGPVASYFDLDDITLIEYPLDAYKPTLSYLHGMGVEPEIVKTYKHACAEGWAPAPTNEYQKAIWDKVHQLPTNPLPLVKPTK